MATGNRRLISHPRNAEDHERPAFVGRIPFSPKGVHREVGIWHKSEVTERINDVRFSNRPFRVKRFQTSHHYSVDVAHGLVLLYGIGTKALPSWDSKTGWNNLSGGLVVSVTTGPSGHANSPHPSSREGHHATARWRLDFPSIGFDPARFSCCCRGLFPGPAELGAVNPCGA